MGKYKDKHGTTMVGDFLRGVKGVAPELLNVVGTVTGVKGLNELGDKIKGTPTLSQHDKEMALKLLEMDIAEAQEVTKRWEADMGSDSWLSKNIRPMVLGWLILFTSAMIVVDSKTEWTFELNPSYILLLQTLLVTVIVAYFGSRGMEKFNKIRSTWKRNL